MTRIDRDLWDEETTLYDRPEAGCQTVSIKWNPTLNFLVPAWHVRAGQTTAVVQSG